MKRPLFLLLALLLTLGAFAQKFNPMEVIPSDSSVRKEVLPSGITYYLKHNDKPAGTANFHIYYKVGAIQEKENQNGLAHFLEHMAFNGSKHYPDSLMDEYLSTIGLRFGENLNAYTSFEQTAYMVTNVPLIRESIVDSVLLILHDWAGFITLDHAQIDKERGVITEEWRQGNNASRRIFEKQQSVLFANTIYAKRNIIGTQQVLQSFKYNELEDFYHTWYRPDMLAFFVIGDFDVDSMEQRLQKIMADIPASAIKTQKEEVVVADNAAPLVSIATDPEQVGTSVQLLMRHTPLPDKYNDKYLAAKAAYIQSLVGRMFGQRLDEIRQKENAPFLGASGSFGRVIRPFDAFYLSASAREGEALRALEAVYAEAQRMAQTGFTQSELDRAKTQIMTHTESAYKNRNDRKNNEFLGDYTENFENGTPYLSPETDLEVTKRVLDNITLAEVNATVKSWVRPENNMVLIAAPEKEGVAVPTEQQVLDVLAKVQGMTFAAYEDKTTGEGLIPAAAVLKGSKAGAETPGVFESTEFTLKNGVKIVVKPTQYKADELLMNAFQKGGASTLGDLDDLKNSQLLPAVLGNAGLGNFSNTELRKVLTGKIAGASPYIGALYQGFNGSCAPKDLETMLQLVYLYYTAPRFEVSDYNVVMGQYRAQIPNIVKTPAFIFSDSVAQTRYGHNPRVISLSMELLDQVSLEGMKKVYRQFFSNANGMTFVFVGSVDVATLKPLAEKYLGSLPSAKRADRWGEHVIYPVDGEVENVFKTKQETPKVSVARYYTGVTEYTPERVMAQQVVRYILEMRYTQSIREEKGGTYGVGVGASSQKYPKQVFSFQMRFDTDTSKVNELLPIIQEQIDDLAKNGPTAEEMTKSKEFFLKKFKETQIFNSTWQGVLSAHYQDQYDGYTGYEERLSALDAEKVRAEAEALFSQKNRITVVQLPE